MSGQVFARAGAPASVVKGAQAHLGNVLILGLGKSGKSAAVYGARLLGGRVDALYVAAGARTAAAEDFVAQMEALGAHCLFGDDAVPQLAQQAPSAHFDVCIASPGIPYWERLYQDALACSDEVISEVEFAWRESAPNSTWVAITGTNGKTTTTACTAALLQEAGFAAAAVGNIGDVCLDAVASGEVDVYVAEVSSYQLASTRFFAPDVAVLLNITPDHVHWHRTFEAYRDAKFQVFANLASAAGPQGRRPVAVLDATNDVVREKVRELKVVPEDERGFAYIPVGTKAGLSGDMRAACGAPNAAFVGADGFLHVAFDGVDHALLPAADLKIPGAHNTSNALMAASAAVAVGADDAAIARALAAFTSLPHRIEYCGKVRGVAFYNDSKATNVDATCVALQAFPTARPVVLLGGDDKGTDLGPLVDAALAHAGSVVLYGEAGPRFSEAFAQALEQRTDDVPAGFKAIAAEHMADALDAAFAEALDMVGEGREGIVLLSPACASFDEFTSFEQRGDIFRETVRALAQEAGE